MQHKLAILVGGVMRWMVDRALARSGTSLTETGSEISPGSLYASGLIAAGGIVGLMGVAVRLYESATDRQIPRFSEHNPLHHAWVSILMFGLLAFSLYYFARKPLKTEE